MVFLRGRRYQEGIDEFTEARNRYNALLHSHEVFWKQRSKSLWLKEGDMNSCYFHMTASARKQKNTFVKLRSNQGQWCSTSDEIDSMIIEYFRNLFTSGGCQSEEVLNCVEMKVTSEQNSMLMAAFSAIEVKEALFGMHPDKSPGPDGMNQAFYQKFWHIVASSGYNPSYVWRSIMAAKHVVIQGSKIQIGSGQHILIGKDPWLPDMDNGFITTNLNEDIATALQNVTAFLEILLLEMLKLLVCVSLWFSFSPTPFGVLFFSYLSERKTWSREWEGTG
ncbi:hypothetical protein AAC387_Pa01g1334 [Persea americana]